MNRDFHHKVLVIHRLNNEVMHVHRLPKIFHNHYEELGDRRKQHRRRMHMVQEGKERPLKNV